MTIKLRDEHGVLKATFTGTSATSFMDIMEIYTIPCIIKEDCVAVLDRRDGSQRLYIWKGDRITVSKPKY